MNTANLLNYGGKPYYCEAMSVVQEIVVWPSNGQGQKDRRRELREDGCKIWRKSYCPSSYEQEQLIAFMVGANFKRKSQHPCRRIAVAAHYYYVRPARFNLAVLAPPVFAAR